MGGKYSQVRGPSSKCPHAGITNSSQLSFWLGLGSVSESSTACQEATASPVQMAQETAPTCPPRERGFDVVFCSDSIEKTDESQRGGEQVESGGRREGLASSRPGAGSRLRVRLAG